MANTLVDWAYTFAGMVNPSDCRVCTELPTSLTSGLPWRI